ncbi:MAG TPA: 7-carboxy-7-deazaguanine synthase [Xanthobacteraceae bacterium]|jgi:7-carboxy-7-deazaguanine synthase (Cx14CxxC type)|nr:7-carboxy-7-deazaguanine synthase [Xanthobacteraceae bacterium]
MSYAVKEVFKTLQGEGALTGRAAVFCRFSGCNLWSGRESDRSNAVCTFCDTDFVGTDGHLGSRFSDAEELATVIARVWGDDIRGRFVVLTGGEPLLQVDDDLIAALHQRRFMIAVETNGTIRPPSGLDWVCVSPKARAPLVVKEGDELKLVYPQDGLSPDSLQDLSFRHFWLQPMDGADRIANTRAAVAYCLQHPRWRLSLQTHKLIGIP